MRKAALSSVVADVVAALVARPDDDPPWEAARKLAGESGRTGELARLYEDAATAASSADIAAALLREAADLHRRAGQTDAAAASYRRALGLRPDDEETRARFESFCAETERWRELAALLEERVDPRLGRHGDDWAERRVAYLRRLAKLYDERLGRPREAAATLERLLEATGPGAPESDDLSELAALYAKLGRWRPMVGALGRLAELTQGTPRATEARRWIAEIYEKELQLADPAIDAYRAVLAGSPEDEAAWAALAGLLERRQRWKELAALWKARAARVESKAERAEALRRCARVLIDYLGRPGEAAALLREARELTPRQGSVTGELVSALREEGKPREAIAELEAQVAQGGAPEHVAGLLLQIATLHAEALGDHAAARRVLGELLARWPDHARARAALAALDQREARALLEAGDAEGARAILARAVAADPGNAELATALTELRAETGDRAAALALLERKLAGELAPEERAQALTEVAELALASGAADRLLAERRLVEALEIRRDHAPALRLLADLLAEDGAHAELVELLESRLPDLEGQPAAVRAEVERRIGLALEELGRPDDAYEHLRRADALVRNDLLTKLALGENRFRAGRWREAAIALQDLATHPDARRHALRVAAALAHAAEAEVRSLRPERARAHYEAALSLDASCGPALRALAEIALDEQDLARAAELLDWEATTTAGPERATRFQALGDLLREWLDEPRRAAAAYRHAVAALGAIDESHTALLANLLSCERACGEIEATADTLELLASTAGSPAERAGFLCEAAAVRRDAGDLARARALADEAVRVDPLDEEAVTIASELAAGAGDWDAVCAVLAPALVSWERGERGAVDRAALWTRLGHARRERGDVRGAIAACERAVEVSRTPESAVPARRWLATLLGGDPAAARKVEAHLRAVVAAAPTPVELAHLARLLPAEAVDGRRQLLAVALALGGALDPADQRWLDEHPDRTPALDQAYPGVLPEAQRAALIADPGDDPLATILGLLAQAAATLWPKAAALRQRLELADEHRAPAAAAALYARIARALGAPSTLVHTREAPEGTKVMVACTFPPLVVVRASIHELPAVEQRFLLGRAAELVRPERLPATGLPAEQFARFLAALGPAVGAPSSGDPDSAVEAEAARIRAAVPLPLRARVLEALRAIDAPLDAAAYRAACERAADRAGLLVAGDTAGALRVAAARGPIEHLVALAVSDGFVQARAQLGVS